MRSFLISTRSLLLHCKNKWYTQGRKNSFLLWENGSPQQKTMLEKSFCKTPWNWATVAQKTICSPHLRCALRRAVCRYRSRIHSKVGSSCSAMTQHYPITSAAAAVWASGPSFPVSAMLLIYTYFLPLVRALSKTLLFVLCLLQTRDKEHCGSSRWLSNLQPCYENSWRVQTIIVTVESIVSSHWYCDDVRLHCSFTVARRLIFELIRLILAHFVRRGTAGVVSPFQPDHVAARPRAAIAWGQSRDWSVNSFGINTAAILIGSLY